MFFNRAAVKVLAVLILLAVAGTAAVAGYLWNWLNTVQPVPPEQRVWTVNQGESVSALAYRLHQHELLQFPRVWIWYARLFDDAPVKAGEFAFDAAESPVTMLNHLQSGEVIQYRVTLVDGHTYQQFLDTLHAHEKLAPTLAGLSADEQMQALGLALAHPEGWFFPDTYQFHAGASDADVLTRAHQRMQAVLQRLWATRMEGLPYETPYEALIMASIVERETGVDYERPDIAGVFVRRLKKNMRLQTDPTVIYGLGGRYTGNITRAHLREENAYNTYRIKGLPPTPIANPGAEAIEAALHPAPGSALYFVAKGDGTHYFSETLAEHTQAVKKYQHKRVENYRSSPPQR